MKITLNRRHESAVALWVVIVIMVIFVIVIGSIFIICCHAIQKIVPPPPPDDDGKVPALHIGDKYSGGTITGFLPHFDNFTSNASAVAVTNVLVFAADTPNPDQWTNLVFAGQLSDMTNTVTLEQFSNVIPAQRYYNIVVSNSNQ